MCLMLWSGETPSLCWSTLACRIFQVDEGMTVVQMVVRMLMMVVVVVNAAVLGAVCMSITVPCVQCVCLSFLDNVGTGLLLVVTLSQ